MLVQEQGRFFNDSGGRSPRGTVSTARAPAAAEGRGYAFEAGAAMRDWAFANTRLRALASYIDPANQRAIALAERLGGQPVEGPPGVVTYRYCARMAEASPKRPGTEPHG